MADMRMRQGQYASSTPAPDWHSDYKTGTDYASTLHPDYSEYPPAMPEYQPYTHTQPQGAYATYGQSVSTLPQDEVYDKYEAEGEYGSTAHLPYGAAPFAQGDYGGHSHTSVNAVPNSYYDATPSVSDAYSGYVRQDHQDGQHDPRYRTNGGYDGYSGHAT